MPARLFPHGGSTDTLNSSRSKPDTASFDTVVCWSRLDPACARLCTSCLSSTLRPPAGDVASGSSYTAEIGKQDFCASFLGIPLNDTALFKPDTFSSASVPHHFLRDKLQNTVDLSNMCLLISACDFPLYSLNLKCPDPHPPLKAQSAEKPFS